MLGDSRRGSTTFKTGRHVATCSSPFHGENSGSSPLGSASKIKYLAELLAPASLSSPSFLQRRICRLPSVATCRPSDRQLSSSSGQRTEEPGKRSASCKLPRTTLLKIDRRAASALVRAGYLDVRFLLLVAVSPSFTIVFP